jgi:hypothetical protein
MAFEKDVKTDAILVHAAMRGLLAPAGIGLGFKGFQETLDRCEWFKTQDDAYITEVCLEVEKMEQE